MSPSLSPYPIHQSPLYKLRSKGRLAAILGSTVRDLLDLASASDNYIEWSTKPKRAEVLIKRPSTPRKIQQPKKNLAAIQKRLSVLLARIERPDYLYSATKGRTYLKNALVHQGSAPLLKVDIKAFYSNARAASVKRFYLSTLQCSPDVARLLASLSVFENRMLATGSALSPLMSFYAYRDLFDRLSSIAIQIGAKFTLYVDDMVFSGEGVSKDLASRICREIQRYGLVGHKVRFFVAAEPKVVTGVALLNGRVDLTNKRRMKIRLLETALRTLESSEDRQVVGRALVGQYREAAGILPGIERNADRVAGILAMDQEKENQ